MLVKVLIMKSCKDVGSVGWCEETTIMQKYQLIYLETHFMYEGIQMLYKNC